MAMSDHPGRYTARETLGTFYPAHENHSPAEVDEFKASIVVECSCGSRLCITVRSAMELGWTFQEISEGLRNVRRKSA